MPYRSARQVTGPGSPQPRTAFEKKCAARTRTVTFHHFSPRTLVPPSPTPSPLNQRSQTIRGFNVVYRASNILNIFHIQHPTDHRCLGQLYKHNWNRPFQNTLRCCDRTRKFSRGCPRTAPRKREGIQGLSGGKSETNQLSQPRR
jgi:hypothetical protein